MTDQQISERLAGVLRILTQDDEFLGTGIAIARDVVITCAHVVAGETVVLLDGWRPDGDAPVQSSPLRARVLSTLDDDVEQGPSRLDVAILRTNGERLLTPLPILKNVTPSRLAQHTGSLETRGFAADQTTDQGASRVALLSSPWTGADGYVRSGQTGGGAPHGLSGAPLLVRERDEWLVAGMFYLGGPSSSHSTFHGADVLLATATAHGCAADDVRDGSAEPWVAAASDRTGGLRYGSATRMAAVVLAAILVWLGISSVRTAPPPGAQSADEDVVSLSKASALPAIEAAAPEPPPPAQSSPGFPRPAPASSGPPQPLDRAAPPRPRSKKTHAAPHEAIPDASLPIDARPLYDPFSDRRRN